MHLMYVILYVLFVLVILIKTYGIIQIIKGFISKNEKQWVKGFYIVALACILLLTTLALGIHGCPKFNKCKGDKCELKNDSCSMDSKTMHHCKMICVEMEDECGENSKLDSTAKCCEKKEVKIIKVKN
jgi:hypothetical protein